MPAVRVNGVRLSYKEHGTGDPILCIHGTSGSGMTWAGASEALSKLGRVVLYDRRGAGGSERPDPYSTSVAQQAEDAAALLEALHASPAIVIGRSYGGAVVLQLALRRPNLVRALVLLEAPVFGLDPAMNAYDDGLLQAVEEAAAKDVSLVAETFLRSVLGDTAWESFPIDVRAMLSDNSPAILAEVRGPGLEASVGDLGRIDIPVLLVAAEESPAEFHRLTELTAAAIPAARTVLVGGGHMIDPAGPEILQFVSAVLAGGQSTSDATAAVRAS